MIIQDYLGADKSLWNTKILATDISGKVLETARRGEYRSKDMEMLPLNWKMNYFEKIDDEISVVNNKIKKEAAGQAL